MKSSNTSNIKISQQKGIWSTTPSNEAKLAKAFMEDHLIILIFSVQGSGHFQVPHLWTLRDRSPSWSMDERPVCSRVTLA